MTHYRLMFFLAASYLTTGICSTRETITSVTSAGRIVPYDPLIDKESVDAISQEARIGCRVGDTDTSELLVYRHNNTVAGYIKLLCNDSRAYIAFLAVSPSYVRQGIGTTLLNHALHTFMSNPTLHVLTWETDRVKYSAAPHLYGKVLTALQAGKPTTRYTGFFKSGNKITEYCGTYKGTSFKVSIEEDCRGYLIQYTLTKLTG